MDIVKRWTLFVGLFGVVLSCSTKVPFETRSPATAGGNCDYLIAELMADWSPKNLELENLNLNLKELKSNPQFQALADLNGLEENREKTYQILALIKKMNPDASDNALIGQYKNAFRKCP